MNMAYPKMITNFIESATGRGGFGFDIVPVLKTMREVFCVRIALARTPA